MDAGQTVSSWSGKASNSDEGLKSGQRLMSSGKSALDPLRLIKQGDSHLSAFIFPIFFAISFLFFLFLQ